jgi:hypothetical protein
MKKPVIYLVAAFGLVVSVLSLTLTLSSGGAATALKTINATGLNKPMPTCGDGKFLSALFEISNIDTPTDIPPSVEVTLNGGLVVNYPNFPSGPNQQGFAVYKGFSPGGVMSASTQIYAAWSGQFFLEEYFCGPGPGPRPPTVQFNAAVPVQCIPTTALNIPVIFTLITSGAIDFDHVGSGLLTASGNGSVATNPVTVEPDGTVQDVVTFPLVDATKAEDVNIDLTFAGSDFSFDKTDDFTLPMICPLSTTTTTSTGGSTTTTTQGGGGGTTTTTTGPGGGTGNSGNTGTGNSGTGGGFGANGSSVTTTTLSIEQELQQLQGSSPGVTNGNG